MTLGSYDRKSFFISRKIVKLQPKLKSSFKAMSVWLSRGSVGPLLSPTPPPPTTQMVLLRVWKITEVLSASFPGNQSVNDIELRRTKVWYVVHHASTVSFKIVIVDFVKNKGWFAIFFDKNAKKCRQSCQIDCNYRYSFKEHLLRSFQDLPSFYGWSKCEYYILDWL